MAMFFLMVLCLFSYHTFLAVANLMTWEHASWRRISYLKNLKEDSGSPFTRSVLGNLAAYCCGPPWCPANLRRFAGLRYDEEGAIQWEMGEQRMTCFLAFCTDYCGC